MDDVDGTTWRAPELDDGAIADTRCFTDHFLLMIVLRFGCSRMIKLTKRLESLPTPFEASVRHGGATANVALRPEPSDVRKRLG